MPPCMFWRSDGLLAGSVPETKQRTCFGEREREREREERKQCYTHIEASCIKSTCHG